MKPKAFYVGILLFVIFVFIIHAQQDDFPLLKGPYLGQTPPGMTPEIFAPEIMATMEYELCSGFMNNGRLFIFKRFPLDGDWKYAPTSIMELKDGKWNIPYQTSFYDLYPYNFSVAPDGETLIFTTIRTSDGSGQLGDPNIGKIRKTSEGWSNPTMFGQSINTEWSDNYPSVTKDGTLYFMSNRPGGFGQNDLYRSELTDGIYSNVENLGSPVNTELSEVDAFIAPDESYLIYCLTASFGFGGVDLYITFRKHDGSWLKPVNMGKKINTSGHESRPYVTPDGKFFFFTSNRPGNREESDIYWADAKIIEELKPKELK